MAAFFRSLKWLIWSCIVVLVITVRQLRELSGFLIRLL